MKFTFEVLCPVSPTRIDENVARLTAGVVLVLTVVALSIQSPLLMISLAGDFALRASGYARFSPLRQLAQWGTKFLALPSLPTDAAPKRFAAGVGFSFSAFIALSFLLHWFASAIFAGVVLGACASLEAFLNFCVGCYIYTFFLGRWIPRFRSGESGGE